MDTARLDDPITRRPEGHTDVPLSALQQRMYHLCTSYPGTSSPILYLCWRLTGPVDVDAWTRATSALVDRHESLRTTFPTVDGVTIARTAAPHGIETERIDLRDLSADDQDIRARAILAERIHALLDLANGPLVCSTMVQLGADDYVWSLTVHHLLADGTSIAILTQEMRAIYQAFVTDSPVDLPELPIGYGDFAYWQDAMGGAGEAENLAYWQEKLADVPYLELPTDMPRPLEKGTRLKEVVHTIPGALVTDLEKLATTAGATLFMVLMAGLSALFTLESGQDDVCIGTLVAGRERPEIQSVVGLFFNTVAMRCDVTGNPTFRELLDRTRLTTVDALDRSNVPFGRIVNALGLPRDPGRTQVFQSLFILHSELEVTNLDVAGVRVGYYLFIPPQSIHDLVLHGWRAPDSLSAEFRYDGALFTHDTIARMARRYETLLAASVANPDIRLFEMAMLAD